MTTEEERGESVVDAEADLKTLNFWIHDAMAKMRQVLNAHHNIVVSISGGADSDMMLDMVERVGHKGQVKYVFFNTGMEYQATKDHLDYLEQKYGIVIARENAIIPAPLGCKRYGVPFLSKRVSCNISRLQKHGFRWEDEPFDTLYVRYPKCKAALRWWCNEWGEKSTFNINRNKLLKEFIISHPPDFPISDKCCDGAKKKVGSAYNRKIKADAVFTGVRCTEGGARATAYSNCITWGEGREITKYRPLFWITDEAKREYEECFDVGHSDCYSTYGLKRTGCACCPFGSNFEYELQTAEQYEPKLHKAACSVFGKSYEYTREYRDFKRKNK